MENEFRCFDIEGLELRAEKVSEDGPVIISGYAARFNSWSEDLGGFRERIKPGAFAKALLTSDVRLLFNHSSDRGVLGRTPRTLTLVEDTKGLRFEGILPDTQLARDTAVSIERKDITGNSFSFLVWEGGDEWKEKDGRTERTITEFKEIFDIGPVVFPAYDSAKVKVSSRALGLAKETKSAAISGDDPGAIARARDEGVNLEIDILLKTRKSGGERKC